MNNTLVQKPSGENIGGCEYTTKLRNVCFGFVTLRFLKGFPTQ